MRMTASGKRQAAAGGRQGFGRVVAELWQGGGKVAGLLDCLTAASVQCGSLN